MAVYVRTVIRYLCPKCRQDVARRPGFISTPVIACHACGHEFLVNRNAVVYSWQKTVFWYAWLFLLMVTTVYFVTAPGETSTQLWHQLNQSGSFGEQIGGFIGVGIGALIASAIMAALAALPISLVGGTVAGHVVANRICSD